MQNLKSPVTQQQHCQLVESDLELTSYYIHQLPNSRWYRRNVSLAQENQLKIYIISKQTFGFPHIMIRLGSTRILSKHTHNSVTNYDLVIFSSSAIFDRISSHVIRTAFQLIFSTTLIKIHKTSGFEDIIVSKKLNMQRRNKQKGSSTPTTSSKDQ